VVKRANQHIGATVNDVLMASVSGAFCHYLLTMGAPPVPVPGLHAGERAGPRQVFAVRQLFAPVPLELPAGRGVHGHRILAVKERMDQMKALPCPCHLPSATGAHQLPAAQREPVRHRLPGQQVQRGGHQRPGP